MPARVIAHIIGTGSYLPEKVLTNGDLEKIVDTSDEWIVTRTGISERRVAAQDEYPSDMGAVAAHRALEAAKLDPADVDLILVATMSPDYISPSTAGLIQHKIGAKKAAAMDLQAACTGYLYALSMAKAFVESGQYKVVLVVATEKMTSFMDYADRSTCVLFGDGAAAAVVSGKGNGLSIDQISLGSDGAYADLVIIPGGGSRHPACQQSLDKRLHYFQMSGREVYKHVVRRIATATRECLETIGLTEEDISWLIPHQANIRIIDTVTKSLSIPAEKVYLTLQKYGNTSAASIAIALDELLRSQPLKEGNRLLLAGFGGGLTWGTGVLTRRSYDQDG